MPMPLKILLALIVGPIVLAVFMLSVFVILLPAEIVAFGMLGIGERKTADAVMDGAMNLMFEPVETIKRWL